MRLLRNLLGVDNNKSESGSIVVQFLVFSGETSTFSSDIGGTYIENVEHWLILCLARSIVPPLICKLRRETEAQKGEVNTVV